MTEESVIRSYKNKHPYMILQVAKAVDHVRVFVIRRA